ncbi:uncharacterized protein QC761_117840 [Podospora bellae-mahoneyi]|uniref:Uncharacterized protein n=1 Tax=Podospora bellae-mahoneyi TaxID=2093777 RepID=A0ABR0G0S6_9PEZI|nr:hypothetical protein QC761_117840 [Podospora bellae-mahoneyi]
MSSKPTLTISTPKTANFPHIPPPPHELRSATSLPSATPLSAVSRTSAFRDPIPSSALPSAGLPSAGPFSALFSAGPYSAAPFSATIKLEHDLQKTPITPPVAYTDFLRGMAMVSPALASPPQTGKSALNRTSTVSTASSNLSTSSTSSSETADSDDSEKDKGEQIDSGPSTARSDLSCGCDEGVKVKEEEVEKTKTPRPAPIDIKLSNAPRGSSNCPLSAPAAGANATVFPSMKLPASPAISTAGLYSPRSPLSTASVRSPAFDWEAALKSRRLALSPSLKRPAEPETPTTAASAPAGGAASTSSPHKHAKKDSRSSVRHIREVVTRTVTYTPRMAPAPKGKRRKIDPEASTTAAKS